MSEADLRARADLLRAEAQALRFTADATDAEVNRLRAEEIFRVYALRVEVDSLSGEAAALRAEAAATDAEVDRLCAEAGHGEGGAGSLE
jgi:hypothetical protein